MPASIPTVQIGSRTRNEHSTAFPAGIKILYEPSEAIVDIIFVHGLSGDRGRTWTSSKGGECWTVFEGGSERPDTDRSEAPDIPPLLHWATKLDRPDVIRALVDCRVNSNALNETGTTALVYAIELGRFKCVDVLLSLSTKVEGEFYGRRTPLSVATEFRRDDILKLLIEKGASFYHIDDLLGD